MMGWALGRAGGTAWGGDTIALTLPQGCPKALDLPCITEQQQIPKRGSRQPQALISGEML